MGKYIAKRIGYMALVFLIVSFLMYSLYNLIPTAPARAELEAQKKTINERYDDLETAYKDFLKSIKEKTRGIGEILQDIWKNATPELRQIIQENAELFKQFGFDVSQLSDVVNDTAK